jgi:NAD-reducing hydrogenase large subunit
LRGTDLVANGEKGHEGIGLIEAPRGTLFHHYRTDENDLISMCNLIVSTTNNNEPMNRAVHWVATNTIAGKPEVTEGMLNGVEVAIRAYDPCLSCATHALGQMPLDVSIVGANDTLVSRMVK